MFLSNTMPIKSAMTFPPLLASVALKKHSGVWPRLQRWSEEGRVRGEKERRGEDRRKGEERRGVMR